MFGAGLFLIKSICSVIGKHLWDEHDQRLNNLHKLISILEKCRGKFECLIYEMLLIRKKKPTLNTQKDSILAKLFIYVYSFVLLHLILF